MSAICQEERRRDAVRQRGDLVGLDYLEVGGGDPDGDRRMLKVYFLSKLPDALRDGGSQLQGNVRIEGGRRIRNIRVTSVKTYPEDDPERDDYMLVWVDQEGDHSTYTLRLMGLPGIDPRYDHLDFSFKVDCPSPFDCKPVTPAYPAEDEPEISYLAKDYATFRQLILDRLALIMPDWRERHAPDIGIALVEILAYVGDHLSYYQDAVATEAYLETARQRISVRRHARLVDYQMSEGCNARAWMCVEIDGDASLPADQIRFATAPSGRDARSFELLWEDDAAWCDEPSIEIFEPLGYAPGDELKLFAAHNTLRFYTWGDRYCCLSKGATSATLLDEWVVQYVKKEPPKQPAPKGGRKGGFRVGVTPEQERQEERWERRLNLKVGDVLILEEVLGPKTGIAPDADPSHRHAVRLTRVDPVEDPAFPVTVTVGDEEIERNTPLVEIEWAPADALPFELCISTQGTDENCSYFTDVTVARGNVILVDHGCAYGPEDLGQPPWVDQEIVCECEGEPAEIARIAGRFRPRLQRSPLTHAQPFAGVGPASRLLKQDPQLAEPAIWVSSTLSGEASTHAWSARYDLLSSGPDDRHFVVETNNEGVVQLRFGDDVSGEQPEVGEHFMARYRVGNGPQGNVGAEAINRVILRTRPRAAIIGVRNPLPARGGAAPESIAHARLMAPSAFRQQLRRAVTAGDYARLAEQNPRAQRAGGALVWTGSWFEAAVAIDPLGAEEASSDLLAEITTMLEDHRRIGHDLSVASAHRVPLAITLEVCILPTYLRSHVVAALEALFSNRVLPDGRLGYFHPDRLTFGQGIYLSQLLAAAQAVPGVESVRIKQFERQYEGANGELESGVLPLGPFEIAQVDNDPSFPEHGQFRIEPTGGR
ncbi:MAG: putative baseplate assembly protein [Anaerolineae bacterium]|nr:putative baseplate assembly protein [Anaerolineae bacterium]